MAKKEDKGAADAAQTPVEVPAQPPVESPARPPVVAQKPDAAELAEGLELSVLLKSALLKTKAHLVQRPIEELRRIETKLQICLELVADVVPRV